MTADGIFQILKEYDTQRIIAFLGQSDIGKYVNNPWFLGVMGCAAVLCLVMKWRMLLALIVGLTGFSWLVSYTVERGASLDGGLNSQNLLIFAGGAVLVISLIIYLIFIKGE